MNAYPERSQSPGGNHPRTSMQGGASAVPTPANNTGGGTGWADKGFFKGGMEGSGHVPARSGRSTIGEFLTLKEQKGITEGKFEQHTGDMNIPGSDYPKATCETEDHSFMDHKPGCPQTLPGWSTAKDVVVETLHGQGR